MRDATLAAAEPVRPRGAGPRRDFLARALGLGGAGALAALAALGARRQARAQAAAAVNDPAILNFALNLEYLEAEYYTIAVTGSGIAAAGIRTTGMGLAGPTSVRPGAKVPFVTPTIQGLAAELAIDEQKHVNDIRNLLGGLGVAPVAKPAIDLLNSFNLAAQLAGLGSSFDPFANETNFLLGAYIFEDVGVTAYHGAAPLLSNKDVLNYAAGIYAVESYHSGAIRTLLNELGEAGRTQAISNLRAQASGEGDDYGVGDGAMNSNPNTGQTSIVLSDPTGQAFARTFSQVLRIVYLNPNSSSTPGGFFPKGVNGTIAG